MSTPLDTPFEPARADPAGTTFQCGLCGLLFSHGDRACGSCAIGAGCELVRCPRCGFQFPRESRLALFLGRLASRLGAGR